MPYRRILTEMIRDVHGALGAAFLDWEGEAVVIVTDRPLDADDHDIKVISAYQGIFLTRLRKMCDDISAGAPHRFKLEFAHTRVLSCDLRDGYYIVLIVDGTANEGIAWHRMELCRARLIEEM